MNSNNQHPMDEIIDRELQGLRNPVESKHGVGDAIMAMQASPAVKRGISLKWPLGIGSVAVAAGTVILATSLTTGKAYAGDLRDIASAQEHQKTMHQKSFMFQGESRPIRVVETWIDHDKEALRQYSSDGSLQVVTVGDGKRMHKYFAATPEIPANASIEEDFGTHFSIETITSYIQSDFFQKHSIEKTSGIKLNGRTCDLYNFAKGYYRVWVDPTTKLPLQREVYDKGVTLWQRDIYEYPTSFAAKVFTPEVVPGLPYFDYPMARKQMQAKLDQPGVSQKVGSVTITLKGVVRGPREIRAIWSTSGVSGWSGPSSSSLEVAGVRKSYSSVRDLAGMTFAPGKEVLNEELIMEDSNSFKLPATIRIAAWEADPAHRDSAGKPGKKLVGWASFRVTEVFAVPFVGQLFFVPSGEVGSATSVKADN